MTTQDFSSQDIDQITTIVQCYFKGLHTGNAHQLKRIFDKGTELKAPNVRRSLDEWLTLVSQRDIPAQRGEPFAYRILSIDVVGQQAMVKLVCPLLDHHYIDFLGLLKEHDKWLIVNKMYADL